MDIQWTGMPAVLQQPDMHGYWIMDIQMDRLTNNVIQLT